MNVTPLLDFKRGVVPKGPVSGVFEFCMRDILMRPHTFRGEGFVKPRLLSMKVVVPALFDDPANRALASPFKNFHLHPLIALVLKDLEGRILRRH